VVHVFSLRNVGGTNESYTLTVDISGSQRPTVFTPEFTSDLEPGETALVTVTVTIPTDLSTLSDTFKLTAIGSEGSYTEAFGETTANVNPAVQVVAPADGTGWALKLVEYEFSVTNSGDYTDSFSLATDGVWAASLPGGSSTEPLGAGESVTVVVLVEVPSGVEAGETDTTSLKATSMLKPEVFSVGEVTTTASLVSLLPIIVR
jgi:uncharacterized membrane protein